MFNPEKIVQTINPTPEEQKSWDQTRVQDPEKAHAMAAAGNTERTKAAYIRDDGEMIIGEGYPIQGGNRYHQSFAHDEVAQQAEEAAGAEYDATHPKP